MRLIANPDPETSARCATAYIARYIEKALTRQARFVMALSGGSTGIVLLKALKRAEIPWSRVEVIQVDERVSPHADPARNLYHLRRTLVDEGPVPDARIHAMPVDAADSSTACNEYQTLLEHLAGTPPVLDLVHLGLGEDGHTASLVPDDPGLRENRMSVTTTHQYRGYRRMTLTYPILNRAHRIVWLVTGLDKSAMLARLVTGDTAIPAGHVRRTASIVFADQAAVRDLTQ
jgi:6-phosphogluconolactonase